MRRGTATIFTIEGKNLDDPEIIPDDSRIAVHIVKNEQLPIPEFKRREGATDAEIVDIGRPHRLQVELTLPDDLSTGMHSLRVKTPLATTNSQSFLVEASDAVAEKESNDTLRQAQPVTFPTILTGAMNQFGDVDTFAFEAGSGEEWVFEVIAGALGSGLRSVLELYSEKGEALASSKTFRHGGDARLGYHFDLAGTYYLQVKDDLLRSGGFYRIHVSRRPLITRVFPLGVERGKKTKVLVEGFNLNGITTVEVDVPEDYAGQEMALPFANEAGDPVDGVKLAVSEAPMVFEAMENNSPEHAMPVPAPVAVNGFIHQASVEDVDCYRFAAQKGERLVVDVAADRYGSPLDSKIEIFHADGRPVEIATVQCVAQTFLTLSDRDSRSAGIRLDSWKDLEINNYVMIGSEILQISGLPDYPDEDVSFRNNAITGWRYGLFGTTPSHHAVDTKAYKVQIHPPGATFPPNGMPVYSLYAENDDGGPPDREKDSYFLFDPPEDGDYVVKITDAQGEKGPDFAYQLSLRPPKPDFKVYVDTDRPNIPRGGTIPVRVKVDRIDGFDGEIGIEIPDLPQGIHGTMGRVLPGEESVSLALSADPDAESTDPTLRFTVNAHARVAGQWICRTTSLGAVTVTKEPDILCTEEPDVLTLVPGKTVRVTVKAERQNGFAGRIPIEVRNLPYGVYVLDTGLNGIMIKEGETERSFSIYAEPWVNEVSMPIFAVTSVETRSALPNRNATDVAILRITRNAEVVQGEEEFLQQKKKF